MYTSCWQYCPVYLVWRHSALLPRIDWWIMMTSLWLPWGWMTYEEINNSPKKNHKSRGRRGWIGKRSCCWLLYIHNTHIQTYERARAHTHTHTHTQTKAISSQRCYKVTLHKTTTESYCTKLGSRSKKNRPKKKGNSVKWRAEKLNKGKFKRTKKMQLNSDQKDRT